MIMNLILEKIFDFIIIIIAVVVPLLLLRLFKYLKTGR